MMISHWCYEFRWLSGSFPSFSDKPISKHQQDLNVVSMSGSPRTSAHAIELVLESSMPLKLIFKISYMYYDVLWCIMMYYDVYLMYYDV